MNRLPHATRVTAALALASLWLAFAAIAQAHPHAHRHRHRLPRPAGAARRRHHKAHLAVRRVRVHRVRRAVIHAHKAGDPGVSIVDFSFAPATATIHVGDTITWTNTGKQPHTATADNHSFDTGILHPGQSGSHTFTSAGAFSYFCVVHPFMKGTIVVLASTTTTTTPTTTSTTPSAHTTATTPTTTAPTTTAPTTTSGQTLPFTGSNELAAFALGLLLVGGGFGLRTRVRAEPPEE